MLGISPRELLKRPLAFTIDSVTGRLTPEPSEPEASGARDEAHNGLTRGQIVARLLEQNPSASAGFLARFSTEELGEYLDHLTSCDRRRGRGSVWVRPSSPPRRGICMGEAAA